MGAAVAAIRAARPSIFIAGSEELSLGQSLTSLSVTESTAGLYRCEAEFGNWGPKSGAIGFLYFDRQKLEFGKKLEIKLDNQNIFEGRIMALEADFAEGRPPKITVLAEDRLQDLRMTRRTRSFLDASDSDVFGRIASDHRLQPQIDVPGPTYKVLAQVNQSDLAFLRERARASDAELWVKGTQLLAKKRSARNEGTVKLVYGGDLRTFKVTADLAHQRTKVAVCGWDVSGKSAIKQEAVKSVLASELGSMESGAAILETAIGGRTETLSHLVPHGAEEAQAQAESVFKTFARGFVRGRGVAQANSKIRAGAYVDLQEIGPLFSGKYYVSFVTHRFDLRGMRSEFTAERPGLAKGGA